MSLALLCRPTLVLALITVFQVISLLVRDKTVFTVVPHGHLHLPLPARTALPHFYLESVCIAFWIHIFVLLIGKTRRTSVTREIFTQDAAPCYLHCFIRYLSRSDLLGL